MEDEDGPWQRFLVLPEAPVDHAFYSSAHAQTTKAFMSRLNKEYRVLKSTLPGMLTLTFLVAVSAT
jgi:ubiquitin-conjugating enzyme E2 O